MSRARKQHNRYVYKVVVPGVDGCILFVSTVVDMFVIVDIATAAVVVLVLLILLFYVCAVLRCAYIQLLTQVQKSQSSVNQQLRRSFNSSITPDSMF